MYKFYFSVFIRIIGSNTNSRSRRRRSCISIISKSVFFLYVGAVSKTRPLYVENILWSSTLTDESSG